MEPPQSPMVSPQPAALNATKTSRYETPKRRHCFLATPRKKHNDSADQDSPTPRELLCLQRDVLRQQKENLELEKQKLELEIWLLQKNEKKWNWNNNSAANSLDLNYYCKYLIFC